MKSKFHYIDHGNGGSSACMKLASRDTELPRGREVLIEVDYAGVNRPDVLQRSGLYPPPQDASPYLGLEVAGTIVAVGPDVNMRTIGDNVCALVPGGGYAEYCLTDERQCLPVPDGMDKKMAACIPENYFTVWTNIFERASLKKGEKILVHGGSSGIGLTTIQLATAFGAEVWVTVGNKEKARACRKYGAVHTILYKEEDFASIVSEMTEGHGVDVIADMVGGSYIDRNIHSLAINGRLVQIAFLEGSQAHIDALPVMTKRLTFTGSTLRPRTNNDKGLIAQSLQKHVVPLLEKGRCQPVIHREFSLDEVAQAHDLMESSQHIGKIVLNVRESL